jgi:3,4-dihydroxy 2-butanone 4-phosphate synthase/GTP cyclohydrolase II
MNSATKSTVLDSIESALEDIKAGKIIIVVDDEDRENEGDFITAAENVTPEVINFMSKEGRGLICAALTTERCKQLELDLMVTHNTDPNKTAFTVSVDLLGHGCTTGISAHDRAKTVNALVDENTQPRDLARPGHIFPLIAKSEGVLRRPGHTEATIDLARLAGFKPAGVLVEIMNEDGSMARLPQLLEIAKKHDLKIISIQDLIAHRLQSEKLIVAIGHEPFETPWGPLMKFSFKQTISGEEHFALVKGQWTLDESVTVRVHSGHLETDLIHMIQHPNTNLLSKGIQAISALEKGALIYMHANKAQKNQPMDNRDYGTGAQIIRELGIRKVQLLTQNPVKRSGLNGYGIEITDYISFEQ